MIAGLLEPAHGEEQAGRKAGDAHHRGARREAPAVEQIGYPFPRSLSCLAIRNAMIFIFDTLSTVRSTLVWTCCLLVEVLPFTYSWKPSRADGRPSPA